MTLRSITSRLVPLGIKKQMDPMVTAVDRMAYKRRLAKTALQPKVGTPALGYGGAITSPDQAFAIGGQVKLLDLAKAFPEQARELNILYLVSSALPRFATDLVAWARGRGVRVVLNQNGVAYPAWAGQDYKHRNRPLRQVLEQVDYVIYQSKFCKQGADRYLAPVKSDWRILYNPVNTELFQPASNQAASGWRLLAAGTSHARYRIQSALEALAALKRRGRKVHLTIAGEMTWPGAEADFRQDVERNGLAGLVTRRTGYSRAEAPALFQSADILIHTKYNDPCPTVPVEAMACGVPVVGSGSGGMPELVTGQAGALVDLPLSWERDLPPDAELLADAVENVMDDYPIYREAAREQAVTRFNLADWIDAHGRIFEAVLDQPGKASA